MKSRKSSKNVVFLSKDVFKNFVLPSLCEGLKVSSGFSEVWGVFKVLSDKVLEAFMGAPHALHSEGFVQNILAVFGKAKQKRAVVRVGSRKVSYRSLRKFINLGLICIASI